MATPKNKIILIGCSKTKKPYTYDRARGGRVTPAELYDGQLFTKRVEYAERCGQRWAVLSAGLGLWFPEVELDPRRPGNDGNVYDFALDSLSAADRAEWHLDVARKLIATLWDRYDSGDAAEPLPPTALEVEIHAGRSYAQPLAAILRTLGVTVRLPVQGLGIGQQLRWYCQAATAAAA